MRRGLRMHETLALENPDVPQYRYELAEVSRQLADTLADAGKPDEAEAAYRRAAELRKRKPGEPPPPLDSRKAMSIIYHDLGVMLHTQGKLEAAEAAYRQDAEVVEKLAAEFPNDPQYRIQLADSFVEIGHVI